MGIFSLELYLAHGNGKSVDEIAISLGVDEEVVRQRVEAARLCVEYQIQLL